MTTMTKMSKLSIALSSALVMASACGGSFGAQQPGVREELSLGTPQVDRPALLPLLAAPGTELDVLFSAHAEMWDVRNEYLYLSAEAESEVIQQRPLAWIDREQAT